MYLLHNRRIIGLFFIQTVSQQNNNGQQQVATRTTRRTYVSEIYYRNVARAKNTTNRNQSGSDDIVLRLISLV